MSGHSKWATTKHRKAAQDAKRSALFSKLSRNITVAAKEGGDPNPENNASLAAAIDKAKSYSLPKDKIKTAIDKAFGSGKDAANYETVVYEGYGPCGVAIYCDALTDNSPVVQVVYCSASPKKELPEHITIRSTEQISTALCENVYTVDKSRVGRFVGRCTRREMEQVDLGLLSGLGLAQYGLASPQEDEEEPEPVRGDTEDGTASMALVIAQTERDTYKRMYESLLARMTMEREETA